MPVVFDRLNSSATALVYSACAGGNRLAVDPTGNAYVTGPPSDISVSHAFQATPTWATCPVYGLGSSPLQRVQIAGYQLCWSAGTVTALNPSGDGVLWSTYLGNGTANGIAVDPAGDVTVTGSGLLVDTQPIAGTSSVSVVRIAPDGQPLGMTLTNAASFVPGFTSPGGLATLFVTGLNEIDGLTSASGLPLPHELAGVKILAGGVPAPILAVSGKPGASQQINFQMPFEAAPWIVELQYGGMSTFTSAPALGPGIFTLPDGSPAVQHAADLSAVTRSNPVTAGETIVVYGTGFGPVIPAIVTGAAASGPAKLTAGAPSITIGQSICKSSYAGAAPGLVGVYQINCQVGQDVQSGDQPLQVTFNQFYLINNPPPSTTQSNVVTVPVR